MGAVSDGVMASTISNPPSEVSDLRHRVRRLRWFRESFHDQADELGRRFHFTYTISDRGLVNAFFHWTKAFVQERVDSRANRPDFAIFAAGLMLRELCRADPARKTGAGQFEGLIPPEPMARICQYWPEGFLYVMYCRTLVKTILEQEFAVHTPEVPIFDDLRVWTSLRENVRDDPNLAIGFFDCFMGLEPNWEFPDRFAARQGAKTGALPFNPRVLLRKA